MMEFEGLIPVNIESNVGTVWFTDKTTNKKFFISIGECTD